MVVRELENPEVDRIFRALADATRRDIFGRVINEGLSVLSLAHDYEMSFAAVQEARDGSRTPRCSSRGTPRSRAVVRGDVTTLRRAEALLEAFEATYLDR